MRKASRLFEIIQMLRLARAPVTAARMARELGVAPRSIYRDIEALQAMRVPIEGGRGIGYILRNGFTLPPLMFSIEEIEAIVLSLAMLDRSADRELRASAASVVRKIAGSVPKPLRQALDRGAIHAWGDVAPAPAGIDLAEVRRAIRDEAKLRIDYRDEAGRDTARSIWPLAVVYYSSWTTLVAWCELRQAIRSFRTDRVQACAALAERFAGEGDRLRTAWMEGWRTDAGPLRRSPPDG